MQIISGVQKQFLKTVIYGPEGIGKSTMASFFPNPIFIDIEDGTHALNIKRIQPPTSWVGLKQILNNIAKPEFNQYSTLVIDTADWAENLLKEQLCQENHVQTLGDVGYGKLYGDLATRWARFLDLLSIIARKMHVVLLAHSQMVRCEIPEESGSFDRYELKLNTSFKTNNSAKTKEWAGLVLFMNYKIMLIQKSGTSDNKAKAQGGHRVIYTSHATSWDAKNRYGLPRELRLMPEGLPVELQQVIDNNTPAAPLSPIKNISIPSNVKTTSATTKTIHQTGTETTPVHTPMQTAVKAPSNLPSAEETQPSATQASVSPTGVDPEEQNRLNLLNQVKEAMQLAGITPNELQTQMARRKIVPETMSFENYNSKLLARVLNGWAIVQNNIRIQRETINQ